MTVLHFDSENQAPDLDDQLQKIKSAQSLMSVEEFAQANHHWSFADYMNWVESSAERKEAYTKTLALRDSATPGVTHRIDWEYGTNLSIDFDPKKDKLDFSWMQGNLFNVNEINGNVVITIVDNNQSFTLKNVHISDLSHLNISAKDDSANAKWDAVFGHTDTNTPDHPVTPVVTPGHTDTNTPVHPLTTVVTPGGETVNIPTNADGEVIKLTESGWKRSSASGVRFTEGEQYLFFEGKSKAENSGHHLLSAEEITHSHIAGVSRNNEGLTSLTVSDSDGVISQQTGEVFNSDNIYQVNFDVTGGSRSLEHFHIRLKAGDIVLAENNESSVVSSSTDDDGIKNLHMSLTSKAGIKPPTGSKLTLEIEDDAVSAGESFVSNLQLKKIPGAIELTESGWKRSSALGARFTEGEQYLFFEGKSKAENPGHHLLSAEEITHSHIAGVSRNNEGLTRLRVSDSDGIISQQTSEVFNSDNIYQVNFDVTGGLRSLEHFHIRLKAGDIVLAENNESSVVSSSTDDDGIKNLHMSLTSKAGIKSPTGSKLTLEIEDDAVFAGNSFVSNLQLIKTPAAMASHNLQGRSNPTLPLDKLASAMGSFPDKTGVPDSSVQPTQNANSGLLAVTH